MIKFIRFWTLVLALIALLVHSEYSVAATVNVKASGSSTKAAAQTNAATAATTPATTPATTAPTTTAATTTQSSAAATTTPATTPATTQPSTSLNDITFTVATTVTTSDDAINLVSPTSTPTGANELPSKNDSDGSTLKAVLIPVCTVAGVLIIAAIGAFVYKAHKKKDMSKANMLASKDLFIPTDGDAGGPSGIEHSLPALPAMAALNDGYEDPQQAQQNAQQQYMYMYGSPGNYGNEMYAYPMYANGYQYMIDPATGAYYVAPNPNNGNYAQNWSNESSLPPLPNDRTEPVSPKAEIAEPYPQQLDPQDSSETLVQNNGESTAGQDSLDVDTVKQPSAE